MPLTVRCKSKQQAALPPIWPPALVPCSPACANGNSLFQGSSVPGALGQSANNGNCSTPIIVQAPAAQAPIIIQSPPVFVPMPVNMNNQVSPSRSQATRNLDTSDQQSSDTNSQGATMPVIPAQNSGSDQLNAQSDSQAPAQNAPQSPGPAQPIIINIHNSQDTASRNRSVFAPDVSDDSVTENRINLKAATAAPAQGNALGTDSPVPVVKTPIPETTPGASADAIQASKPALPTPVDVPDSLPSSSSQVESPASTQNKSPKFVLVRHGRLVHLRPVRAVVAPDSSPNVPLPANTKSRLFHYVGWS